MTSICTGFQDELIALDAIVSLLPEQGWHTMTPAKGYPVRGQLIHLGGTDRVAAIAAAEPERFNHEIFVQDRAIRLARL